MPTTAHAAPGTVAPADLTPLPAVEPHTAAQVAAAVAAARTAQPAWARRSLDERIGLMEQVARTVLERRREVLPILASETGKSESEALGTEVATILDYARMAGKEARIALAPSRMPLARLEYPGKRAVVEAVPRGVVGIIAPWNYPFGNFLKSIFPALLAGNGIVMKPSEHTPRTARWLAAVMQSVLPEGLVQIALGAGEVGAALLDAGVDAVVFTGSVPTGRKVAARAGELLIPASVELGGKDAAIVLADCNFERTVAGVLNWGMHNCGQNCAGLERVYVEAPLYDRFVAALGAAADRLRVAPQDGPSDLAPLQNHAQLAIVERHVADARQKGARVVAGGERCGPGLGYRPTILADCTDDMLAVREETFGPVLAVMKVADAEEGVARANASPYGLNGSVWTTDLQRGEALARRLEVGVALVNNHAITGAMAQGAWTGTKDTGTGVAASRYSYPTFVRRQTIFVDANRDPDPWWLPLDDDFRALMEALIEKQLGSLKAVLRLLGILKKRTAAIKGLVRG